MKKLTLIILIGLNIMCAAQTNSIIDTLFINSYKVFELQRLSNGMYRDSRVFSGNDYHPVSVANTGMGLVSLCIADSMNWIGNAKDLALITLKTSTDHNSSYNPDRNCNGFFRHFLDINTGAQAWESEYSTIDTDILMCGALFCMNYFQDDSISKYAIELWKTIDFEAAIADPNLGKIYLEMNTDGTGKTGSITFPYNEYMIVAWLAKNATCTNNNSGDYLWENYYSSPENLQTNLYEGINVLSDNSSSFLSSFTHQFNYYLCNYFTTSNDYVTTFKDARKADSAWWAVNSGVNSYEWGLGAGSSQTSSGYNADAINNNQYMNVSPHIIAGFIPVYPNGKNDLIAMWNSGDGKYTLPDLNNDTILWRYSLDNPAWQANEISGVDHSTMLFGLASLPEYLGNRFFSTNNDFFPLQISDTGNVCTLCNSGNSDNIADNTIGDILSVYPNPTSGTFVIDLGKTCHDVYIEVFTTTGQKIIDRYYYKIKTARLKIDDLSGLYLININSSEGRSAIMKVIKN